MVLTRSLEGGHQAGRLRTLGQIQFVLEQLAVVEAVQVSSLLEKKHYFRFVFLVLRNFFRRRKALPLQCVLFAASSQVEEVLTAIRAHSPDVVYFDTIRCASLVIAVSQTFPDLKLVADFDDLMSRRCAALRAVGRGFTLGYLARFLPGFVQRLCRSTIFSSILLRREERALRRTEAVMASLVDSIMLVSQVDAEEFTALLPSGLPCNVIVAPPPFKLVHPVRTPQEPLRYIFIGSDSLLQNRITIEWLVDLWQKKGYSVPLHIYGKQSGAYNSSPAVVFEGYAESLSDVYAPNSIVLAPSFVSGGVKTKIAEALAHGIITIGNELAYEGLGIDDNPLVFREDFLENVPAIAPQHLEAWTAGARLLQDYFLANFGHEAYRSAWVKAILSDK